MSESKQLQFKRIRLGKRAIVIGLAALVAVIIAYIYLSDSAWSDYKNRYTDARQSVRSASDAVTSAKNDSARRVAVQKLVAQSKYEDLCKVSWWYGWRQEINGALNQSAKDCEQVDAAIQRVNRAARALEAYYAAENALSTTLSELSINKKSLSAKDWKSINNKVAEVKVEISGIETASDEFESIKIHASKRVDSVTKAWQSLQKAHKAENRGDFTASIDSLDNAYLQLRTIAERSDAIKEKLTAAIKSSAQELVDRSYIRTQWGKRAK